MCHNMIFSLILIVTGTCLVGVVGADEILVYTFDEGSGTAVFDQTGNGRDGVITDATWQAGGFNGSGWALSFQGGAKVEDDDGGDYLNGLDALTMAAWVRSNIVNSNRGIINGEPPDGGDNVCTMRYDSSGANSGGTNVMKMAVTTGGGESQLESSSGVQTTEWQHVAMTWESGGLIRLYINGEEDMGVNRNNPNNSGTIEGCNTFIVGQGAKDQTNSWDGLIDEVRLFDAALTAEELQLVMLGVAPEVAKSPVPGDGASDVNRDTDVSWEAGDFAATHNVFLSTSFGDVNDGTVVVGQGLTDTTFDPGRLAFDQTYFWRVDEVNSAPDLAVFTGDVWSFTTEPFSIPIAGITATASSSFGASGPEKTIDGSGLADDLHGNSAGDMWISAGIPATIEYAFDRVYKLHELWIWNSNQLIEAFVGFGGKDVVIEHSLDGENWTVLDGVGPLAQAPGSEGYAHNNTIDFAGAMAQHVRLTVNSVQGIAPQASLSEVRFFFIPVNAREPQPGEGAMAVSVEETLRWRSGREADRHELYLGTDLNSLSLAGTVNENSFDTLALDLQLGQTHYWRVDEVNDTMDPSTWTGDVWSFTTVDAIDIDDMERYADAEFLEIWATWVDGFDDPTNGSLVGNGAAGTPETDRVHGGSQSLPLNFDNSGAAQSEATRTFDAPMDWSGHGVASLVLYFEGSATNTGGNLYVKINGTKIAYDGDASNLMRLGWNKWTITLAEVAGVDLSRVSSLTIGVDGGGQGLVFVDDIELTSDARELITPAEPVDGLVAYYSLDGDYQDASGNGRHGTPMGGPIFEPGASGQAVSLNGIDQYVEITGYKGITAINDVQQPFTVANWFKSTENGEMVTWGASPGGQRLSWRLDGGSLRTEHGNGNLRGNTVANDGEWHHGALVVSEGANLRPNTTQLYLDGMEDSTFAGDDDLYNLQPDTDVSIGNRATSGDRFFPGSLDEVRIYDRTLSAAEVAWLAGRRAAFDKP